MNQKEIFEHMLMYITQHELLKTHSGKITLRAWKTDGVRAMNKLSYSYARVLFLKYITKLKLERSYMFDDNIDTLLDSTYMIYENYYNYVKIEYAHIYSFVDVYVAY